MATFEEIQANIRRSNERRLKMLLALNDVSDKIVVFNHIIENILTVTNAPSAMKALERMYPMHAAWFRKKIADRLEYLRDNKAELRAAALKIKTARDLVAKELARLDQELFKANTAANTNETIDRLERLLKK